MSRLLFYRFSNLKKLLPDLLSTSAFITSANYLGSVKVEVSGLKEQIENLGQEDQLQVAIAALEKMAPVIKTKPIYRGTKEFKPLLLKKLIKDKTLRFAVSENEDKELGRSMNDPAETKWHLKVKAKEWYAFDDCFGTAAEKKLIHYIDKIYCQFKSAFHEVYLVKNERFFQIYHFGDGHAIELHFLLLLIKKMDSGNRIIKFLLKSKIRCWK